jgi:hypothetical protein
VSGSWPLPLTDRVRVNAALAAAYRQLLADVARVPSGGASSGSESLGINQEQSALLMADVGSPTVWVLEVGGTQVSAAKSMGVGMLSGVATLLTFGVGFVAMPVDAIGYQVALVDLQSRQIVWRKPPSQMRRDPGDMASYDADWAKAAFTPLIDANSASGESRVPSVAPAGLARNPVMQPSPAVPSQGTQAAKIALGPRTTSRETPLRKRPMLGDEPFVQLAQRADIDVQLQMTNAQGEWLYVKAAESEGWVPLRMMDNP